MNVGAEARDAEFSLVCHLHGEQPRQLIGVACIEQKNDEVVRLRRLNKALLAVARRYAPKEHSASCVTVWRPDECCECGYSAAHATIAAASQPSSASVTQEKNP